jgi:glycosyltransferase involved in cell wall biosynthesis
MSFFNIPLFLDIPLSDLEKLNIYVVIPAFKARKTIAKVIEGIPSYITKIIVVDDNCPESTYEEVGEIARQDSRLVVLRHSKNGGVGAATVTGYFAALDLGADIIIKMDADDQMDPSEIPKLLAPLLNGEADYTKGNRFLHLTELQGMPFVRRVGNYGLSFLSKVASGHWHIFDPTNGFTAIHSSILSSIDRKAVSNRFFFESSLLIELAVIDAVVVDVAIPARYGNNGSTLSPFASLWQFPPRLLKGALRRLWLQNYIREFGLISIMLPFSILLLGFGTSFGLYNWIFYSTRGIPAPLGTIIVPTLTIILGVQFFLQALWLDIARLPKQPLSIKLAKVKDAFILLSEIQKKGKGF